METAQLEVLPDESALVVAAKSYGLAPESLQSCLSRFQPLLIEAKTTIEQAQSLKITASSTPLEKKLVKTLRISLKDVRCRVENERKAQKEDILSRGKAIDGMASIVKAMIEPVERNLEDMEKFEERQEAARKAALKEDRSARLRVYGVDPQHYQLEEMSVESFDQLLENTKIAHEAKIEAARKAEADRIAAENARLAEEARVREENARLKREAAEREEAARQERLKEQAAREVARQQAEAEAKAAAEAARKEREAIEAKAKAELEAQEAKNRAEREAAEAKANAERQALEKKAAEERAVAEAKAAEERAARQQAEAELKAAREAEAAKKAAEEKAAKQAPNAGDRDKLVAYAAAIDRAMPSLKDQALNTRIMLKAHDFIKVLHAEAEKLDVPQPKAPTASDPVSMAAIGAVAVAKMHAEPPKDLFGGLPQQ
jgi:hypothetical protein